MKYIIDITGMNDYRKVELNPGESKVLTYTILGGKTEHKARVTAGRVVQEPTTNRRGCGFVKIEYLDTRRTSYDIHPIIRL